MLYRLLISLLLAVVVHGTQQGKAKKLRKQREKRKSAVRMLRTNAKKLDDVIEVVASSQSPSVELSIENREQQQSACTAMMPNSAEGGMLVYLNQEREAAVALDVPREATVATLVAAAAISGVDLRRRTLRFCGESLSDQSTSLADIGVGAEAVIDVSRFVWNRETLKELQPIRGVFVELQSANPS